MNCNFKLLILLLLICFTSISLTFGQETIIEVSKEKYKLNKQEFLDIHGTDDTSRALINYFFKKRSSAHTMLGIWVAGTAIEILVVSQAVQAGNNTDPDFGGEYVYAAGAILTSALIFIPATGLGIGGLNKAFRFSKKRLYIQLMAYKNGHPIPTKYKTEMAKDSKLWR